MKARRLTGKLCTLFLFLNQSKSFCSWLKWETKIFTQSASTIASKNHLHHYEICGSCNNMGILKWHQLYYDFYVGNMLQYIFNFQMSFSRSNHSSQESDAN